MPARMCNQSWLRKATRLCRSEQRLPESNARRQIAGMNADWVSAVDQDGYELSACRVG